MYTQYLGIAQVETKLKTKANTLFESKKILINKEFKIKNT